VEDIIKKVTSTTSLFGPGKYKSLTMQKPPHLRALQRQIESIVDSGIDGDVYETGTWRGGTSIFMVSVFRAYEALKRVTSKRKFYFFDSYEGFAEHGSEGDNSLDEYLSNNLYKAPIELVRKAFEQCDINMDDGTVHLIKGFFEDTVPKFKVNNKIALLRLDGDLYSSTMVVLEHFYDYVNVGGWVVIDDYFWKPKVAASSTRVCKDAIHDFRSSRNIREPLTTEYTIMSWQKSYGCTDIRNMHRPTTMQMNEDQVKNIMEALPRDGNLLVWGLGNDSPFWKQSTCGRVVFIEDNEQWMNKISNKYPDLEVHKVSYFTEVQSSFEKYMQASDLSSLTVDLSVLRDIEWDVIIVDAPAGNYASAPGRFQSIYTSYQVGHDGTYVFVDDFDRKVEREFSKKVFGTPISITSRDTTKNSVKNTQACYKITK
jgi:uncharacterized protein (TIGR01627 family)